MILRFNQLTFLLIAWLLFSACGADTTSGTGEAQGSDSLQQTTTDSPAVKDNSLMFAFYNVENLFDTEDDPNTDDNDFLPESEKEWTPERYNKKLNDLSKVLAALREGQLPAFIGMAEIENKTVLQDLAATEALEPGNYDVIHEDSPDARGIDVALLYSKDAFTYLSHSSLPIEYPFAPDSKGRNTLYVKGLAVSGDTLHIFVNHWKSRRGGTAETEPKRVYSAEIVRNAVDSLLALNPNAKIIIAGDLNDTPTDKSVFETLRAANTKENAQPGDLYNLMYDRAMAGEGTHNYRGEWSVLDHLIVSQALLNSGSGLSTTFEGGQIYREDWILYENPNNGNKSPNRTYGGPNYYGGYSDHLPVFVVFTF